MEDSLFRPVHIHWDMTGQCNLECLHCRATSAANTDELSTEEGKALIDQIDEIRPEWMSFDGGEALLRKDFMELAAYASGKGLFTYLLTNGTLITPTIARNLKEVGIGSVQISVDGLEENHNLMRGEGIFKKTMRGAELLQKEGIRTSFRITLTKQNIGDAVPLQGLAIDMNVAAFGARRVVCVGNAAKGDLAVDEKIYADTINELIENGRGKIEVHIGMDPVLIPVTPLSDKIKAEYGTLEVLAGCGAGISLLHIGSNGDILPCGVLPLVLGNVRADRIIDVWNSSEVFMRLRERDELKGECGVCAYRYVCGGCRASAWGSTGDYLAEDPQCLLPARA